MKKLNIILIAPRGFCAGVSRAVEIVNKALEKYPHPIYVKHEIVHNKYVVDDFKRRGVIFVSSIAEVPSESTLIFSAHGVSLRVEEEAKNKNLNIIDATCPLVKKVHNLGINNFNKGYQIVLIGHKNHPETIGTAGRVPNIEAILETKEDVKNLKLNINKPMMYITQTTLSSHDIAPIVKELISKYPTMDTNNKNNICYATQNRQNAILSVINKLDALLVVGSNNSSNSNRLKEIATKVNKPGFLVDSTDLIPFDELNKSNISTLGISAGASAPSELVDAILNELSLKYKVNLSSYEEVKEDIVFYLPKKLR